MPRIAQIANSLILASVTAVISGAAYASLVLFPHAFWDLIWFAAFVPIASVLTAGLGIRDIMKSDSRWQGTIALLLIVPQFYVAFRVLSAL